MPDFVQKLFFGAGLDVSGLFDDAGKIESRLAGMGKFAGDTFQKQIARELARSIDPANFQKEANAARASIQKFGDDAKKIFEQTLGANQAKRIFDPIRNESNTLFGQIKQGFTSTFGVGKISLGVGIGNIAADVAKELAAAAAEAIKFAAEFESALAQVQTIADKDFNLTAVRDEIQDIATRIPQDLLTLTKGLGDIIGSGFSQTAEAMRILEVSAKAATAGVTQTAEASRALVFVLNAFGKGAEDAEHISDVLFKTVDEGVISFQELSANIGDVAGPAALVGASFEDIGAAMATLTKQGINAAESVTSIRSLITKIIDPSEQAQKAAASLGITLSKAGLEAAGGFNEFVKVIAEATKGDVTKLQALFPEERAFRAISRLAGTASDEFQRLAGSFNNLSETSGATNRAFAIMNETAENQFKLFKNNLANAIADVGQGLLTGLKPALNAVNNIFSNQSDIEKLVDNLGKLGVSSDQVKFLTLIEQSKKAQQNIIDLTAEIERLTQSTEFVEKSGGFFGFGKRGLVGSFLSGESIGELSQKTAELAKTEQGRVEINKQIADSQVRIVALTKELGEINLGFRQGDAKAIEQQINKEITRQQTLGKVLEFQNAITEQEKAAAKAQEQARIDLDKQRGIVFDTVIVEATRLEQTKLTAEQQKEIAKRAEEAEKFIAAAANKLELLQAIDEPERRLIAIRQEADERRKQFAGQAKAIEAVNKLERAERKKTIDDFEKQLEKEIKNRIEKIVKLDIQPKLITDLKLPEIEFDEQRAETIGERINKTLNEVLVESPASVVLNKITELGPLLDEEFINFVGVIDKGLADVLAGIANFATNIASGNILGAVTGAIGVIGGLFGSGDSKRKRAEAERREQQAQEEAARAAESAAQALEDLRRAAEDFGSGKLVDEIKRLDDEISEITNSTRKLTQEELERTVTLLDQANTIRSNIEVVRSLIEAAIIEGRSTEELDRQLRELEEQLGPLETALNELGINFNEVTSLEIERLNVLLKERGILDDVIKRFGAFDDSMRGLIERLNFGFDFIATEPAKKLEALLKAVTDTFEFKIPERFNNLQEFILAAVEAMQAGGQTLIDFLAAAGLEELTAEEFAEFLRTLDEFSKGVEDAGGDVTSAFEKFLEGFGFVTDILDIDEPRERLQAFRNAVNTTFGSDIPESFEAMKKFILDGFIALQGDADSLKAFLASIGLEELTREEFKNLLLELEGGLDAIASKFAELNDQLNLQFDLLDIDDPIEKLKKLQSEILKRFGAIIPTTKEEIDALIASGVDALLSGGDALKAFLASIDLEELTAAEFEELLKRLKDFGEEAAAQIEDATQAAEEITTSQVKSITFTQGNKLIDEVITMRVVLTQMLDTMRGGLLGSFPNINLDNLAAALTGLNGGSNNYFIVRNGSVESISENQLSEIDRRLIEQARRAAQARGVS